MSISVLCIYSPIWSFRIDWPVITKEEPLQPSNRANDSLLCSQRLHPAFAQVQPIHTYPIQYSFTLKHHLLIDCNISPWGQGSLREFSDLKIEAWSLKRDSGSTSRSQKDRAYMSHHIFLSVARRILTNKHCANVKNYVCFVRTRIKTGFSDIRNKKRRCKTWITSWNLHHRG